MRIPRLLIFNFFLSLFSVRVFADPKRYPPGVAAILLASYEIEQLQMPGVLGQMSMTVSTFPIIPAYALTPDKVRGVALDYELYMPRLPTRAPHILYVGCNYNKYHGYSINARHCTFVIYGCLHDHIFVFPYLYPNVSIHVYFWL